MYENMHCCKYCKHGKYIPVKREVFCKKNAVVSRRYICQSYEFDPFKLKVQRPRNVDFSKFKAEDFKID